MTDRDSAPLARHDGHVLHLHACCDLDVTIGTQRVSVAHDDDCPALHPEHPQHVAARGQADLALRAALEQFTGHRTTLLLVGDTEALLLGGDDA